MDEAGDCSLPQTFMPPIREDQILPNATTTLQADPSLELRSKITRQLISLGSTLLADYADLATDYDPFVPRRRPAHEPVEPKTEEVSVVSAVAKLNKAAQRAFGAVGDFLKYDYSEEFGPLRKRCILEIIRTDGSKRVYSTKHEFARKSEAKTKAASIAIDHGAIDFMLYGDEPRSKGHTLAPVNTPLHAIKDETTSADVANNLPEETQGPPEAIIVEGGSMALKEPTGAVAEIEKCCQEWRAGRIKPTYYFTSDTKSSDHGCALKVNLSDHVSRAYSVVPTFKNPDAAQSAVAHLALEQDIIDFIRHGDGQQEPLPAAAEYDLPGNIASAAATTSENGDSEKRRRRHRDKIDPEVLASRIMTVASFFDSLPQPLPEPVGVKTAEDTNPVAWLNGLLQRNRGSLLTITYMWTIDPKLGLHGCVMRVQQGSRMNRSYLVDPVFAKRQDAKIAVCLEAISLGVSEWIRSISISIEDKLTKEMRDRAKEVFIPAINSSLQRLKPPQRAEWTFSSQNHAIGCALTISLDSTTSRKYVVPTEYRTRGDAKLAVALHAVEEGVVEFIRFRGGDPPDDYDRDAYEANRTGVSKRTTKQVPSSSNNNQPIRNEVLRKRKFPSTEDHRHGDHRSPNLHAGSISGEEHYMDYSSRAGDRWDSFSRTGLHGPHRRSCYPDYLPGRDKYHPAPYLSLPHLMDSRDPSSIPLRRAVYSGTYHDLDHPTSLDRGVPQAYTHSYHPWRGDDECSPYPYWSHPSRGSVSRDYPVLDYSTDEGHSARYFSRAPEPSMGADDARHGSRLHSVSRASADRTSTESGPAVPNAAFPPQLDLVMPERHPRSFVRPPLNPDGPSPQLHLSRPDRTSLATELTHDGVREDLSALTPNETVIPSKEWRSHSQSTGLNQSNEVSLRERAKASRKRNFSITSESAVHPRRWEKRPRRDTTEVGDLGRVDTPAAEVKPELPGVRPNTAPPKPAISQLFEFCAMNDVPVPELHSETVPSTSGSGLNEHKVWMIVGRERLELPNTHTSLSAAQEKLAKLVLSRLTKR